MRYILYTFIFCSGVLFAQEKPAFETRNYVLNQVPMLYTSTTYSVSSYGKGGGGNPFGGDPFGGGERPPSKPAESDLPWARKTANPKFLEEYFTQHLGIEFPEGSWMKFQKAGNVLSMRNSEKQHAWLKLGLAQHDLIPTQVKLSLRMVEFDQGMMDQLERQHLSGIPDDLILELWEDGEGKTIASQSVKTVHGVNAILECVDEIIYPTEMAYRKEANPEEKDADLLPEYGGFETRNIGAVLNITPTVNQSKRSINLVLLPEKANKQKDPDDQLEKLIPFTPLFRSLNMTSSLIINSGATLVAGHSSSLDNKSQIFLLISAELVDAQGQAVTFPVDEFEEEQP